MQYVLCGLCLLLMGLFINVEHKEKYGLAVVLKGLASLCFVAFGYFGFAKCQDLAFAKRVLIGLCLGLIADVLLNLRFVFKKNGKIVFLVGILVFLAGHIMYLAALIPSSENLVICIAISVVLTAITMVMIFKVITAQTAFKIFGVFYIGAIMTMTAVAIGLLYTNVCPRTIIFVVGALSFLASDIILILNTFGKETKFSLRIANLSLYYIGQLLIALSLFL